MARMRKRMVSWCFAVEAGLARPVRRVETWVRLHSCELDRGHAIRADRQLHLKLVALIPALRAGAGKGGREGFHRPVNVRFRVPLARSERRCRGGPMT